MGQSSLARSLASWNVLGVSVPHFTAIHRGRLRLGTPGPFNMEDCSRRSCGTIRSWRCPTAVSLDGSITAADSAVHRLEVRGLCLIQRKAGLVGIDNICTNIKSVRSHKNSENNNQTTDLTRLHPSKSASRTSKGFCRVLYKDLHCVRRIDLANVKYTTVRPLHRSRTQRHITTVLRLNSVIRP
jgi:hypothetical protein